MLQSLKDIEKIIIDSKYNFIRTIIKDLWKKDPNDYNISIDIEDDYVNFNNWIIHCDDFVTVANHDIKEEVFNEYQDAKSLTFESKRYNLIKEIHWGVDLRTFNYYCYDEV